MKYTTLDMTIINKRKKVGVFIYSLDGGGAERVVSILLKEVCKRTEVVLILMSDKIVYPIPDTVEVLLLENSNGSEINLFKFLKIPILAWKFNSLCKVHNIGTVLSFMNRPSYISALSRHFKNNSRLVIFERSTPSEMYKDFSPKSILNKFLIRVLYSKSDLVVSNSAGNRNDLINNFGLKENSVLTLNNPIDVKRILKMSKSSVNVDFSRFSFISVGRIDEGKNHNLLLEAYKRLDAPNSQLIIVGDGPLKHRLVKKINDYNLEEKVLIIGFDSNPYKYMARSDVFLFSSNYEGFPNVLVEALSCGLPVVSTDCRSGPREILENGKYGVLTKVGSVESMTRSMDRLYLDADYRRSLSQKALTRALEFDKNVIMKSFLSKIGIN